MKNINYPLQPVVETEILRYSSGASTCNQEKMAQEAILTLFLEGRLYRHLLYLPGLERELALGFLLTAGSIEGLEDIAQVAFDPLDQTQLSPSVRVTLTKDLEHSVDFDSWLPLALLEGKSQARQPLTASRMSALSDRDSIRVRPETLLALMAQLPRQQNIFSQTGATHAICIADPAGGEIILSAEDVGRHNAFDKVIGQALLQKIPLYDKIALLSGRASYEMVLKAARAGIPFLSAVSAPTFLALKLAECQGITLVGFARNNKMNIYTHDRRRLGLRDTLPLPSRTSND